MAFKHQQEKYILFTLSFTLLAHTSPKNCSFLTGSILL
jgi:hypothetical protein